MTLDTKGKDLIIIIGPAHVGKSTIINAFLGVPLKFEEESNQVIADGVEPIVPISDVKKGGINTTKSPHVYYSDKYKLCFLEVENATDTILLKDAINQANNVRIVSLCNYDSSLTKFNSKELSEFISHNEAPVFCLFNKYYPSFCDKESYLKWFNKTPSQRNDSIDEILKEIFQNQCNALQSIPGLFLKHPEIMLAFSLMHKAFENHNFGHIDPTSQDSVEEIIKRIQKLQPINVNHLILK